MKRIEINCEGIPNARELIEAEGFVILMSPNYPSYIHVEGEPNDLAKLRRLLGKLGRSSYQEIDNGQRTVKTETVTPLMMFNRGKHFAVKSIDATKKNKRVIIISALSISAAITAAALYFY